MKRKDLKQFDELPCFVWAKDEDGRYMFANRALVEFAKVDPTGKTDRELPWAEDADEFRAIDQAVLNAGTPQSREEHIHTPKDMALHTRKWVGELDGKKGVFGISFSA